MASSANERILNRLDKIYDAQGAGGAAFADITGEPTDNAALGSALSAKVPTSRTVNGQALSGDVVVTGRMLDTAGAPDNGVGNNGDFAFDDATKTIYGPKAAGVWPAGVVLEGQSEAQVQALIGAEVGVTLHRGGYETKVANGGTTTLTVASKYEQVFTGSDDQEVKLPVTSTLYLGFPFLIINKSSGVLQVVSSGSDSILDIQSGVSALFTCILTSGTSAASWQAIQLSGFASLGYVNGRASSGSYTPTATAVANLDSVSVSACQAIVVDGVVTVSGIATVDPALTVTTTKFRISLNIPSVFANPFELAGVAFAPNVAGMGAAIYADVASGEAMFEWKSTDTTSQTMSFIFTYKIL